MYEIKYILQIMAFLNIFSKITQLSDFQPTNYSLFSCNNFQIFVAYDYRCWFLTQKSSLRLRLSRVVHLHKVTKVQVTSVSGSAVSTKGLSGPAGEEKAGECHLLNVLAAGWLTSLFVARTRLTALTNGSRTERNGAARGWVAKQPVSPTGITKIPKGGQSAGSTLCFLMDRCFMNSTWYLKVKRTRNSQKRTVLAKGTWISRICVIMKIPCPSLGNDISSNSFENILLKS